MNNNAVIANESVKPESVSKKRIMIAGIGNVFLKDDGFGAEVIRRIEEMKLFENVELNNVGISGLKLAYDLMKGYDGLILVDASSLGERPGTLYVIELDKNDIDPDLEDGSFIDPHGADPARVLRFIKAFNAWPQKVVIVACEPETAKDFGIGLSKRVAASVSKAVELVEEIVNDINKA